MSIHDERGMWEILAKRTKLGFEANLPPWKRWLARSNNRMISSPHRKVKAIRGVHDLTIEAKVNSRRREPCEIYLDAHDGDGGGNGS